MNKALMCKIRFTIVTHIAPLGINPWAKRTGQPANDLFGSAGSKKIEKYHVFQSRHSMHHIPTKGIEIQWHSSKSLITFSRFPMMMSRNWNIFRVIAGNSPVTGEFPSPRPVTRSFDVFFDLHPNKRLSKQSWGWWFDTPSRSLWRHCNAFSTSDPRYKGFQFTYLLHLQNFIIKA